MDSFFGLGLAFALIAGLVFMVPAFFILVVAFVYVRQQRGQPVDINSGVSAYTVILIGLGALLLTLGLAQLLTAIVAEIDGDYTYGVASFGFDTGDFDSGSDLDGFGGLQDGVDARQEDDVAAGLATFVAGAIAVGAHLWLRAWLAGQARLDRGVEAAWDVLFVLAVAVTGVVLVAQVIDETLVRAISDDDTSAAGSTIAQVVSVLVLWGVYAYRALGHVGVFRDATGGPGGGETL